MAYSNILILLSVSFKDAVDVVKEIFSVILYKYSFNYIFWSLNLWPFLFSMSFSVQHHDNKMNPHGEIIPRRNWSFGLFAKNFLKPRGFTIVQKTVLAIGL